MFYLHTSFKTTTEFLSLFESFSVMCIHILYNTCIDVIHVFLYYIFLLGGGSAFCKANGYSLAKFLVR